jgi:hypothetical protein
VQVSHKGHNTLDATINGGAVRYGAGDHKRLRLQAFLLAASGTSLAIGSNVLRICYDQVPEAARHVVYKSFFSKYSFPIWVKAFPRPSEETQRRSMPGSNNTSLKLRGTMLKMLPVRAILMPNEGITIHDIQGAWVGEARQRSRFHRLQHIVRLCGDHDTAAARQPPART